MVDFAKLVQRLQTLGETLAREMLGVDAVKVLGIDLTARAQREALKP